MSEITYNEIAQAAEGYLKTANIYHVTARCMYPFRIIPLNDNLYYVVCSVFDNFIIDKVYRMIIDSKKNLVSDISEVSKSYYASPLCLDEANILIPSKIGNSNSYQHLRIENNKGIILNTFSNVRINEEFKNDKLIFCIEEQSQKAILYNFEKNIILRDEFDYYLTGASCDSLRLLAISWGVPEEKREEFIEIITKKMQKEHLIGGYKKIEVFKEGIKESMDLFIFIDKNGNFVSGLYYVDDFELLSFNNISSENINSMFKHLECRLSGKIDRLIAERQAEKIKEEKKKNNFLQLLKKAFED